MREQRGQAAPSAVVVVMLLMALAGALIDGLHILAVRHRAYRVAADAALQGVREGADYNAYVSTGTLCLDPDAARSKAEDAVAKAAAAWGLDDYVLQVEVLPHAGGGAVPGFPPHPNARQGDGSSWQTEGPAVGVYIEADVGAFFLGWFNDNTPITIHAFAAAAIEG